MKFHRTHFLSVLTLATLPFLSCESTVIREWPPKEDTGPSTGFLADIARPGKTAWDFKADSVRIVATQKNESIDLDGYDLLAELMLDGADPSCSFRATLHAIPNLQPLETWPIPRGAITVRCPEYQGSGLSGSLTSIRLNEGRFQAALTATMNDQTGGNTTLTGQMRGEISLECFPRGSSNTPNTEYKSEFCSKIAEQFGVLTP